MMLNKQRIIAYITVGFMVGILCNYQSKIEKKYEQQYQNHKNLIKEKPTLITKNVMGKDIPEQYYEIRGEIIIDGTKYYGNQKAFVSIDGIILENIKKKDTLILPN